MSLELLTISKLFNSTFRLLDRPSEIIQHVQSKCYLWNLQRKFSKLKTLDTYFIRTLKSMKWEQGKVDFIKLAKVMAQDI